MPSSRRVSATVVLALIATGWYVASAAPVANNARRLQDNEDIRVANGGPIGPGLSESVAIAENILRKYGITKTFADILDLDAGMISFVAETLNTQNFVQGRQQNNLENLLNRVVGQQETAVKGLQSIASSSPLEELPGSLLCQLMELVSQRQSFVGGLQKLPTTLTGQGQLQTRMGTLQGQLNNVQGQLQHRGRACAQKKP